MTIGDLSLGRQTSLTFPGIYYDSPVTLVVEVAMPGEGPELHPTATITAGSPYFKVSASEVAPVRVPPLLPVLPGGVLRSWAAPATGICGPKSSSPGCCRTRQVGHSLSPSP